MYLNCHTAFSFKYGTLQLNDLFNEARRCGVHKLVLTEINNTASYIEMLRLCAENAAHECNQTLYGREAYALEIAVGIEFRKQDELLYIAIAKNNAGFEEVNRFLSHHNLENKPLPNRAPHFENVFIIYPFKKVEPESLRGHEFIGVKKQELTLFSQYNSYLSFRNKFVVWHPVTFATKLDFNTHRLLRAINYNTLLSKLAEHQQARPEEVMMPEGELEKYFEQYPELVQNTRLLLDRCSIEFKLGSDKNKKHLTGSEQTDSRLVRISAAGRVFLAFGLPGARALSLW